MSITREAIKDAIERQVGGGLWLGIAADDGRYEGSVERLDVDLDSIAVEEIDLDAGVLIVTALGGGIATHKDADGEEMSGSYEVIVTARIAIGVSSALIIGVSDAG